MLRFLFLGLLCFVCALASAEDFYWLGKKSGSWKDPANWSLKSGGESLTERLPGKDDKVIIDKNSGAVMRVDTLTACCSVLEISRNGVTLNNVYDLKVYGDVSITAAEASGVNFTMMPAVGVVSKLTSEGKIGVVKVEGEGKVELTGDLEFGEVHVVKGMLDGGSHKWTGRWMIVEKGSIELGDGSVDCSEGVRIDASGEICGKNFEMSVSGGERMTMAGRLAGENFSLKLANCSLDLSGGGRIAGKDFMLGVNNGNMNIIGEVSGNRADVIVENGMLAVYSDLRQVGVYVDIKNGSLQNTYTQNVWKELVLMDKCSLRSDVTADVVQVLPGGKMEMEGNKLTVNSRFSAVGTADSLIFLGKWQGMGSVVCKGDCEVRYAELRSFENKSGKTLVAANSVDMGGNLNWQFGALASTTYYRKEGGEWKNLDAWYLDEDFKEKAKRLPTAVDDVVLRGTVTLSAADQEYNVCRNLTAGTEYVVNWNELNLHIFGNVELNGGGMIDYLNMYATMPTTFKVSKELWISIINMNTFTAPDGSARSRFTLLSNVHCDKWFLTGALLTNGFDANTNVIDFFYFNQVADKIDASNSRIKASHLRSNHDVFLSDGGHLVVTDWLYERDRYNYGDYLEEKSVPLRDGTIDQGLVSIKDTVEWVSIWGKVRIPKYGNDTYSGVSSVLACKKLELLPGADCFVEVEECYAEQLVAKGNQDTLVKLMDGGNGTKFYVGAGPHEVEYCLIEGLPIAKGNVKAVNSWLCSEGLIGWDVSEPQPQTLYWVGGSGRWSDRTHWSENSGGEGNAKRIPMPCDKLFFDSNSGLEAESVIELDVVNCMAGDLSIGVPCVLRAISEKWQKLCVAGNLEISEGVQGELTQLWLWGRKGRRQKLDWRGGLIADLVYQRGYDWDLYGNMHAGAYIGSGGSTRVFGKMDVNGFKLNGSDSLVLAGAVVDVADWRIGSGTDAIRTRVEHSVISCYKHDVYGGESEFKLEMPEAAFLVNTGGLNKPFYDELKLYGPVKMGGFRGSVLYVAPWSWVGCTDEYGSREVVADTVVMLGAIEGKTSFSNYSSLKVNDFAFFSGVAFSGGDVQGNYDAWFCDGNILNEVGYDIGNEFTDKGVQLVKGGHLCNVDTTDLFIPGVMRDTFHWVRNGELVEDGMNLDTLEVRDGGEYYCVIDGKLGSAESNRTESVHEYTFAKPNLTFVNDSVLCHLNHGQFELQVTAYDSPDSPQKAQYFNWLKVGKDGPVAERTNVFTATEEGCYEIDVVGLACRDTFPVVCTRWVETVPDNSLLVKLGEPARHCPDSSIVISVKKLMPGIDSLWYSWTQDGTDLGVNADTLEVVTDGLYVVSLNNICGASSGVEFDVRALVPPSAPWQAGLAARCEPGDVLAKVSGTNGNMVEWLDENGLLLASTLDTSWVYPDIADNSMRKVRVRDADGCPSELVDIELQIDLHRTHTIEVLNPEDTLLCPETLPFDVRMQAWRQTGDDACTYHWLMNGKRIEDVASAEYVAKEAGVYQLVAEGLACSDTAVNKVSLRVIPGPPDAGLMKLLSESEHTHCPGTAVRIGLQPIVQQRDSIWYRWRKDGEDLSHETDTILVKENGVYAVNIFNKCGSSDEWKEITVQAVVPPLRPVQDSIAAHCGPGDIPVRISGVNTENYVVHWYGEDGQEEESKGYDYSYVYEGVEESGFRYVALEDKYGCLSEQGQLTLTVYEIPALELGNDREVEYRTSILLEGVDVPFEGTFKWSPCNAWLNDCNLREPLFTGGTDAVNTYRLDYLTPDGCPVSDSVTLRVYVDYKFPSVLTVNGDGLNERWEIYGFELAEDTNELYIYDVAGKEVFHARPYKNDWDGRSSTGAMLPAGSYVYRFTPDGVLFLTGMVSIIRR